MTDRLPSLTQEEARARAELLTVERYDVDVDLTGLLQGGSWRATSTVSFGCSSVGASTFADCAAEVVSATLNGKPVPAEQIGPGRIRLTGLRAENVLVVEVTQHDSSSQRGVQRCVDPQDGEVYVWTSFAPDDARFCWACFDQPDLKAPHAFTVLAPETWTVLSNRGVDTVEAAEGGRRWTFPDTPPLSTYVVVVNAGPFHEVRSKRGGHDLGFYCRKSLAEFLDRDAEELFGLTEAGLAFFAGKFGQPFGQERYDQVYVPDFGGAMENWGCVTLTDAFVYRAPPTRRDRALRAEYTLHEMAHMWFGDLVTMRWWDDLWLNEAFASWASAWACTQATDYVDAWATFLTRDKTRGYAADRSPTRHPIRQPSRDVVEGSASFDAITYCKGASVLKQLVALVGETAFTRALQAYFTQHAWGSTTLDDLIGAVERASGRDLAEWTTSWLDSAGSDRIELEQGPDGWLLRVTGPDQRPPRRHRLAIGEYGADGDRLERRSLRAVETDGGVTELGDPLTGDLHLLNDEDLTFAQVRPDPRSRELLLARCGDLPTPMARTLAVCTVWEMLADAEVGARDFVGCAVAAVRHETEAAVAEDVLGMAQRAAEQWAPSADRDDLLLQVADLAAGLAGHPDLGQTALRVLARTASHDAHVGQVRAAAGSDTELGWSLLVRLAELGRLEQAELDDLAARDPDPDVAFRVLAVRAALADPAAKEAAWRALFVDRTIGPDRVVDLGTAFWRPGQAGLLREYAARFLDAVTAMEGGVFHVMEVASGFFPAAVGDHEFLARVRQVAGADDVDPVLRRVLLNRADVLSRMLRTRSPSR